MNNVTPIALEHVAADLVRRGLPVDYAQRAATELADHHCDLVAELHANGIDNTSADAEAWRRLGGVQRFVRKSVNEYQRRHWCGRWPLLSFLLGPVFMLAATWIAIGFAFGAIAYIGQFLGLTSDGHMDLGELLGGYGMSIGVTVLVPCLIAAYFWRLARRAAMVAAWPLISCLMLGLLAGQVVVTIDPAKAMMTAGIVYPPSLVWFTSHPVQLVQFMLPLLMIVLLLARQRFKAATLQVA
jgi:hypothetical protein